MKKRTLTAVVGLLALVVVAVLGLNAYLARPSPDGPPPSKPTLPAAPEPLDARGLRPPMLAWARRRSCREGDIGDPQRSGGRPGLPVAYSRGRAAVNEKPPRTCLTHAGVGPQLP